MKPKKPSLTQKVLRNSLYQITATAIAKLGGFIFTIIVARMLFPELFGIYSLALAVILILITFADLGINSTLIRYTSEALGKKQKTKARSYTRFLLNFKLLIAGAFALALFLIARPLSLYAFHKEALILPLQIGSVYLFATALLGFFSSLFYAIQKVKLVAVKEIIFQITRIGLVIAFLVTIKSVPSVFIALSIAAFVAFLLCFFIISKSYYFLLKGPLIKIDKKRLLKFFGYLSIGSITGVFFIYIDRLMLGAFLPSEFVGFYTAIFAIVGAVAGLIFMADVLLPVFTQIKGQRLERAFKKAFHYSAIFSFPCAFGFAALAPWILKVVYGAAYVPAEYRIPIYIASALLAFLIIEIATGRYFSTLFYSKEKPQFPAKIIVIATVLNIVLNYFFIRYFITIGPAYGLIGAALATFISRYFYFGALAISSKRKLRIVPRATSLWKPLAASLIMLGFLIVYNYFVRLNLLLGITEILLAVIIYFVVMWLIKGITKEDFKLVQYLKPK
ncbi:MAG: oligosaccharide flippase family protein [Candidatus Pacearchaeota archaeon]|nr:MAG: oligosaccharide flippase family protein [Candidatus Pacearchaeota archaeon]